MRLAREIQPDDAVWLEQRLMLWREENPDKKLIRLDQDTSGQPMRGTPLAAMQAAVAQLGCKGTFQGSGPAGGHAFAREAAAAVWAARGAALDEDELFLLPGIPEALTLLLGLAEPGSTVLVPEPCAPFVARAARWAGHTVLPLPATEENGFLPGPEHAPAADIICLCAPANPVGTAYDAASLSRWVAHAASTGALLVLDTTYAPFAKSPAQSVLADDAARGCAVELQSLAAIEGFCGAPCVLLAMSRALAPGGEALYGRFTARLAALCGGVAYPVQRAVAAYLASAQAQAEPVTGWRTNAATLARGLEGLGVRFWGGEDAPFFWLRCPEPFHGDSRAFFEALLTQAGVTCAPGALFGASGEGWFRLSALGDKAATEIAVKRLARFFAE